MTKYYKGYLFEKDTLKKFDFDLSFRAYGEILSCTDDEMLKLYQELDYKSRKLLEEYFNKPLKNDRENQSQIYDILTNKVFTCKKYQNDLAYQNCGEVIYEMIEDENHDLYGKEILTGAIFPIAKTFQKKYEESITQEKYAVLDSSTSYEKDIGKCYIMDENGYYCNSGKGYYIKDEGDKWHWLYQCFSDTFIGGVKKGDAVKTHLVLSYEILFSNLLRGEVYIENNCAANQTEIEEYKVKNSKLERTKLFGKKESTFLNRINRLANLNVFKGDIVPITREINERKREQLDDLTKLMEEIELLLLKLKNYNMELYNMYLNEYNKMIEDDSKSLKNITINKGYLEGLKAKILLSFSFNHEDGMNILEYLDNLKKKYLLNLFDGGEEKTKVSIEDLDKMTELFLKMQNEYSIVNKRKIMRNIALLYLFELYENKDNLDNLDLENSYLNDNLVSVLICLNTLKELDLIESDVLINLNSDIQLEDVIYIVKNITFKKISQEKVLSLTI